MFRLKVSRKAVTKIYIFISTRTKDSITLVGQDVLFWCVQLEMLSISHVMVRYKKIACEVGR